MTTSRTCVSQTTLLYPALGLRSPGPRTGIFTKAPTPPALASCSRWPDLACKVAEVRAAKDRVIACRLSDVAVDGSLCSAGMLPPAAPLINSRAGRHHPEGTATGLRRPTRRPEGIRGPH